MKVFKINGPSHLEGRINVQGSKNAVLPMMAAAVMTGGKTVIQNCPDISDIHNLTDIIKSIGCSAEYSNHTLVIDSSGEISRYIPAELMERLRSSFLLTGAVLARCGSVSLSMPGGCKIGLRPVDIHTEAFKLLGAKAAEEGQNIEYSIESWNPCDVHLRFPSVGATENIMILSACQTGTVRIINAACEPEIIDLQNMLNSGGAKIFGAGTPVITITGVRSIGDICYKAMPDRIVTATYLTAAALCGGEIELHNSVARHISSYIALLRQCGVDIYTSKDEIIAAKRSSLKGGVVVRTMPYPGFATDTQSLVMAVLSMSKGVSVIQENIFEDRFRLGQILKQMGADITISGRTASISGVQSLKAASADACDLRSGAALAVAMLAAEGCSELGGIHYIERGYEDFSENLISLGANMERIEKIEN